MTEKFLNARDFGAKGSDFTTKIKATAGSNVIEVENIGDFEVGDEIVATNCFVNFPLQALFERIDSSPINTRKWIHNQPVGDRILLDGYDGSQGTWKIYMFDFSPDEKDVFRWTDDNARTWHENIKICDGFTDIENGVRIKIGEFKEREYGCTAVFVCDNKMVAVIEKIEGNKIYLSESANVTAQGELMHSDTLGIQKAVDAAIRDGKSVFLPNGEYTLAYSINVFDAGSFTSRSLSRNFTKY